MSALEQMYQQVILDHARSPHGRGLVVDDAPASGGNAGNAGAATHAAWHGGTCGTSHQVNPTCGDEVTLRVDLDNDVANPRIVRVSWDGQGCSISQASLSVMTDLVSGESLDRVDHVAGLFRELMGSRGKGLGDEAQDELGDAAAFTGVSQFPARIKCALLGWAALKDATVGALAARGSAGRVQTAGTAAETGDMAEQR